LSHTTCRKVRSGVALEPVIYGELGSIDTCDDFEYTLSGSAVSKCRDF